jgi:hypothetical protein
LQPHPRENNNNEQHSIFGVFFIFIALSIALAAIVSKIASLNKVALYHYVIIWIGSFAVTFFSSFHNKSNLIYALQRRMKNSLRWSTNAKILNGVCWAGPFATIAIFPSFLPYLVLLGIALGNISTYLLLKRYNGISSHEQLIVGVVSLAAIPVTFEMHSSMFVIRGDVAIMLSRIFVSLAYAAGGIYAIKFILRISIWI